MTASNRVPLNHDQAFQHQIFVLGIDKVRDFENSTKETPVQSKDKETGELLWVVDCINGDPDAREKQFKVKIAAPVQPVPPPLLPGTPFRPVEFIGLTMTPWVDSRTCVPGKPGEGHRCRAKQGISYTATGMREPQAGRAKTTSTGPAAAGDSKAA